MKTIFGTFCVCVSLAMPTWLLAQSAPETGPHVLNHAEVGIFADYLRFGPGSSTTNFVGTGARAAFNVSANTAIEGEMSYDFARNYTTTERTGGTTTVTTTFVNSRVRPLTGLFGPRFQFGTGGPFRVFATGKVGFIDFSIENSKTVSGATFSGAVAGVGNGGTHLALYPGGGIEGFFGPLGIRAEAGDEIFLNNGTYNNLRIQVGPTLRF